MATSESNGNNEQIVRLLQSLREDLTSHSLNSEERRTILERLKILGRNPTDAGPIFTKDGIEVLSMYGFGDGSSPSSLEALKCIANALLLEPKTRKIFVELGYSQPTAERLKLHDFENGFLVSRILFLLTYDDVLDFEQLFDGCSLGDSINEHLSRHAKASQSPSPGKSSSPMKDMALSELLKLLFNISNYYPHRVANFEPAVQSILQILCGVDLPSPALQPPVTYLINALLNLEIKSDPSDTLPEGSKSTSMQSSPNPDVGQLVGTLISILSSTLTASAAPSELESTLTPLLTLLRKLFTITSPGSQKDLKASLLPSSFDRALPLGKTSTLASRLLNLCTSPTLQLSEAVSSLLYTLSDSNADTFVHNVGYGYAAGFLLSHNIPVPDSARVTQLADDEEEVPVNPVTGQKLSQEDKEADGRSEGLEGMTEEEKEREAERLFVLFQRLQATGVVSVGNPMREAVESGQLDESKDVQSGQDRGPGERGHNNTRTGEQEK